VEHHSYPLPTDTRHVRIESRQYEIFNFDLGEGIVRSRAVVAAIIVLGWVIIAAIAGVPLLNQFGPACYLGPPAVLAFFALRTDNGGRPAYALWWDYLRYFLRRGRPIVPRITGDEQAPAFTVRASFTVIDVEKIKPARGTTA
jgi:hypothetical protein